MIEVRVIRSPGGILGPDIVDRLITTDSIAVLRGTAEINSYEPTKTVSLTVLPRSGIRKRQIISVIDLMQGAEWRGKITAIVKTKSPSGSRIVLTVDRFTRYYP